MKNFNDMKLLYGIFGLVCFIEEIFASGKCPISCSGTTAKLVENFCISADGNMNGRCCMSNATQSYVIGLDLSNCNLTSFKVGGIIKSDVEIIDLHGNSDFITTKDEFLGYQNLKYLYLPFNSSCPGGYDAWNSTSVESSYYTECYEELNPCHYLNVSCTINGQCLHEGPGSAKCVCLPGYRGYKCLQQGYFPAAIFGFGISVPTIFMAACLWYFFRRHVIVPVKAD